MIRHSVQPRDRIFVKGYRFLSITKNMAENICKNMSKILSGKYNQKRFDHSKQSAADAIKTNSKKRNSKSSSSN